MSCTHTHKMFGAGTAAVWIAACCRLLVQFEVHGKQNKKKKKKKTTWPFFILYIHLQMAGWLVSFNYYRCF